jgi:arsenite-transporting ATPase
LRRITVDQITTSMTQYMKNHPRMKYIFFGGKGGVGKTVMAGTAALWAAKQGKKTLLASTNPVHSLSSLLEQDVFGKAAVVCDEQNCYAFEIDTKDTIERSKNEIRKKMNWFLKFADITTKADDFVESATMNPAFEESAMFENMVDLMFKDEYDFYVFDTAPTANARRLLGMSKVYSQPWGGEVPPGAALLHEEKGVGSAPGRPPRLQEPDGQGGGTSQG